MRHIRNAGICLACFIATWVGVINDPSAIRQPAADDHERATFTEPEATHALDAMRWFNNQRAYPTGIIPLSWREKALRQIEAQQFRKASGTNFLGWTSVGPNNLGGRVRSIVINPFNPSTIYCGSVSGGVWKSTNAGALWFPTTDQSSNLVISSMVMDPTDTNIVYASTGEGFQNIDALRGGGVLRTANGGATWTTLANFLTPPVNGLFITKLVIRPDNASVLYAGMIGGIWKTTNSGGTWTKLSIATRSNACTDLVIDQARPDTMYASFGIRLSDGVYKTTNGGTSWALLSNGFPPRTDNFHRVSLALAPSNPSVLYAAVADSNDGTHSIQKTTNGGTSWFTAASRAPYDSLLHATHLGVQGWYNNVIAVHPTNPNLVYAGGIDAFRSFDGGATWSMMTFGYLGSSKPFMHVDQHAIAFDPTNPSIMYFGNDGGMYKTTTGGNSVADINNNLAITQMYSGAIHPTDETYYGGAQDIGIMKSAVAPAWTVPFTGDGGVTIVDFTTPTTVYSEYVFLAILKSTTAGSPGSWSNAMGTNPNNIPSKDNNPSSGAAERCDFISPIAMDPNNSQILYAGTYRIFRSSNGAASWTAVSSDLTGDGAGSQGSDGSVVTAITVPKSSSTTLYVGTGYANTAFGSGTQAPPTASRVLVGTSTNGGTTWSWSNVTSGTLPNRYVRAIGVDPANASRAFVCYSGYGTGHVFRTTNRGASWSDVSSNLPDIPVNAIVIDPANANHLIVGTDFGVFESLDGGISWVDENTGLANVCVLDLDLRADGFLFASTHGRGMFKSTAPIGSTLSPHLTVSVHQNPVLTRYVDIFLMSDTALASTPPSARIRIGSTVNDSLAMTLLSPQVYKGSYEFSASGSATLSFAVNDTGGNQLFTQRLFQVQFLKQGVARTVIGADGLASIDLSADAIPEDMYLTIVPESNEGNAVRLISHAYTFGPVRKFAAAPTIAINYAQADVAPANERHLTIERWDGTAWTPVASTVDHDRKLVSAQVSELGTFALAYDERIDSRTTPVESSLEQNYPNPFNPSTTIRYKLGNSSHVVLSVYDITGRLVTTLIDGTQARGGYTISWRGDDLNGTAVASGVYVYRLTVRGENGDSFSETKKMLLMK